MKFIKKLVYSFFLLPFFENILLYVYNRYPFKSILKLIPPNTSYPIPTIRNVVRNGIKYELDISSFNQWAMYWIVPDELIVKEYIYNLAQPGMVVLDVGANIGEITLNVSQKVGNKGKVYAIEPFQNTFKQLEYHIVLNNFDNITSYNLALGEEDKEVLMEVSNSFNMGMNKVALDSKLGTDTKMKTLDSLVESKLLDDKIDIIKIDVEGYEHNVLKGAKKILNFSHPILVMEMDNKLFANYDTSIKNIIHFLKQQGYKEFLNISSNKIISEHDNFDGLHFDILCK